MNENDSSVTTTDTNDVPMMQAPQWLIDLCLNSKTAKEFKPKSALPPVKVDLSEAEQRALDYLDRAPQASIGNRNGTTFAVAAKLRDFGIPAPLALQMIQDHYNGQPNKCEPALDDEEVEHVVKSAYKYANSQQGHDSPEGAFSKFINQDDDDALTPKLAPAREPMRPTVFSQTNPKCAPALLPKQEWLLGRFLLAGKVTVIIAPGGAGKSTLSIGAAMSLAANKNLIGMNVHAAGSAWIINNEDDETDIFRRVNALMLQHNVSDDDLGGRLHIQSDENRPFTMAKRTTDGIIKPVDYDEVLAYVRNHNIKLVVADPFAETHLANENSNEEILQVARMYRRLAKTAKCAVLLIHHTRKPAQGKTADYVGDANSGRGASSLINVARVVSTLYTMTDKDAKRYGINIKDKHRYARLDDAKANLSLMSGDAHWFHKTQVRIANDEDVGVLVPVTLTSLVDENYDEYDQVLDFTLHKLTNSDTRWAVASFARTFSQTKNGGVPLSRRAVEQHIKEAIERGELKLIRSGRHEYLDVPENTKPENANDIFN